PRVGLVPPDAGPPARNTRPDPAARASSRLIAESGGVDIAPSASGRSSETVERAMRKRKRGSLKSGRSGKKVTSRKQAIAIGLSEARKKGGKVPRKRTVSSASRRKKA